MLTPNEFDILYTLAINKGKVLWYGATTEKIFSDMTLKGMIEP